MLTLTFAFSFVKPAEAIGGTLISNLQNLVDNKVVWNTDPTTSLIGYNFGKLSLAQLQAYVDSQTDWRLVFYMYAQMMKYNVVKNQTVIKWALDNATMLPNGLPVTYYYGSTPTYLVHDRYAIQGYYYAQEYNYETSKWNSTNAYLNFQWASQHSTGYSFLWLYGDNTTSTISYGPRYYDECAETMDVFLRFYELGIQSALTDALNVWNWVNNNLWAGDHFNYAYGWPNWECESGGFLQIALKLKYYASSAGNITRVTEDMVNRYIANRWASPQWSDSVVVHHYPSNSQKRLQNTLMAWSSLLGNYYHLTTAQQANLTGLLTGYGSYEPAWKMLYDNSGLHNASSGLFRWASDGTDSASATAAACSLTLMEGIVPGTGSLAMPISENVYEDTFNMIDADLYNLNFQQHKLRLAIQMPGTISFQYGTSTPTYNFTQPGLYDVTFSSDWNTISSVSYLGGLPTNRVYFTGSTPNAAFTYHPLQVYANMTVTFDASASSAGSLNDTITQVEWTINDPYNPEHIVKTGNSTNPPDLLVNHTFAEAGTYVVGLNVTSSDGLWSAVSEPVIVLPENVITIRAHCITESADINVSITMDGSPTGYTTPHSFTGLTGTHTFAVPSSDANGDPFKQWSTSSNSTTITVSSAGTYTAYYRTPSVHDVAITDIRLSKTVVGQNYSQNITVTVLHPGDYTETFDTAVYANQTIIAMSMNTTLASGTSITITFTWNTTSFAYGNYTIWAYVWPVPGETDTTDNNFTDGLILVTILGDVNGDFKCEGKDIAIIAKAYGSLVGQAAYVPNADINDDGKIDGRDIAVAAKYYGTHYP